MIHKANVLPRQRGIIAAPGENRRSAGARSSSQNENLKAFVADIAVKTGKGRSTVARDVTRAKKVAVLDDIAGTCLDKGDEIDALGKLPEGEQRKLATAARARLGVLHDAPAAVAGHT